jgi:beta-lactamase superfamily II metal-dependent hydrolase
MMPYEIDFHPVGNGSRSGDAITMRYHDGQQWRVLVIDGGYQVDGEKIVRHVRETYGTDVVEHVVSTHPDNDHIGGLATVLEELTVGTLWMHVPHFHADAMMPYFLSSRWTVEGLRSRLKSAYPAVTNLMALAEDRGTTLGTPFQGARVGPLTILSPSKNFYEGLLPQFRDTPQEDRNVLMMLGHWINGVGRRVASSVRRTEREDIDTESLREGGTTAAENESSIVLGGILDGGVILLTGDAGLRAMGHAADYADRMAMPLQDALSVFQVPHHGSRNNVSPSMLDRIAGQRTIPGSRTRTVCVISAGPDDDTHPRQVVVNALIRRGHAPLVTRAGTILCPSLTTPRSGFEPAVPLSFSASVEAYD